MTNKYIKLNQLQKMLKIEKKYNFPLFKKNNFQTIKNI